jgi:hypothetical protein
MACHRRDSIIAVIYLPVFDIRWWQKKAGLWGHFWFQGLPNWPKGHEKMNSDLSAVFYQCLE